MVEKEAYSRWMCHRHDLRSRYHLRQLVLLLSWPESAQLGKYISGKSSSCENTRCKIVTAMHYIYFWIDICYPDYFRVTNDHTINNF